MSNSMEPLQPGGEQNQGLQFLTVRALIYGTLFSILLAVADPYVAMVCKGLLCANSTPVGTVFLFAIALFVFNMLLRGIDNILGGDTIINRLKLRASELVVVYIMLLVTSAIPTLGFSQSFIAILTGPSHFSTDQNHWNEKIIPHINPRLIPGDTYKREIVKKVFTVDGEQRWVPKTFYEGFMEKAAHRAAASGGVGKTPEAVLAELAAKMEQHGIPTKVAEFPKDKDGKPDYPEVELLAKIRKAGKKLLVDEDGNPIPPETEWVFKESSAELLEQMAGTTEGIKKLEPNHIKWLYTGMPGAEEMSFRERIAAIPWWPWIRPYGYWMIFMFAFYMVSACLVSLLRKQWIERERLQYPLVQLPMAMVEGADVRRGIPALFRNKLLWMGFAIPMFLSSWNQLAHFFQLVTPIPTSTVLYALNKQLNLTCQLNLPVIGFTYLIKLEVALSLWLFSLVGSFFGAFLSDLGVKAGNNDMWLWRGQTHPFITHACFGAVLLLALLTLWSARRVIWNIVRRAFLAPAREGEDESKELMPHFATFWGLVVGLTVMMWWMCEFAGMDWWFAPIFVVVAMLGILAATRMIAEGGLVFVQFSLQVPSFMFRIFHQTFLGPANLVGMSWGGVWVGDIRVLVMPAFANATKLADHVRLRQRALIPMFLVALVVAIFFSSVAVLYLGYTYGGEKVDSWIFGPVARDWFNRIAAENIQTQDQIDDAQKAGEDWFVSRTVATLAGAGIMIVLALLRAAFLWWPLHPLGFPFAVTPAMQRLWLGVAIGWLLKATILRYGGAVLFRKLKPFFYGLILGEFCTAGAWYVFYFFLVTFFHGSGDLLYN